MPPVEQEWFAHLAFGAVLARRLNEAADIYHLLLRLAPHNTAWLMGLCYCLVNAPGAGRYEQAAGFLQELGGRTLSREENLARTRLLKRLQHRRQRAAASDTADAA